MSLIHPTAIVDPGAELADDVKVGPYAVVGAGVTIGAGTVIHSHCVIHGPTIIGQQCQIGPGAYLGLDPQHMAFLALPERPITWLVVGDRTIVRETATLHRSTKPGKENATNVGSDCLIMGGVHIGHDCVLADHVIMANSSLLGGHCHISPRAFLGGGSTFHQFVRIGRLAIISGNEAVSRDVPPFSALRYGGLKGYNAIGCKRAGISPEAIHAIRHAYRCIHGNRMTSSAVTAISQQCSPTPEVKELLAFIAGSKRGIQPSLRFVKSVGMDESE